MQTVRPTCSHTVADKLIRPRSPKYRPALQILTCQNPRDPTQLSLTAPICKSMTTSSASACAYSGTTWLTASAFPTTLLLSVVLTKSTKMEDACVTSDSTSSEINAILASLTNLMTSILSVASASTASPASTVTVLASTFLPSFPLLLNQSPAVLTRNSLDRSASVYLASS